MAKKYFVNNRVRFVNAMMARMIRWNIAPAYMYLLTVRGRKSGTPYSLPVRLIELNGSRWLVSPYGEVNWVKNARAAGQVELLRGSHSESFFVHELNPQESATILKEYINKEAIVRPYFDVRHDAPVEDFVDQAAKHPVFRLQTNGAES